MPNQSPEQLACDRIDAALWQSGWTIQDKKKINLNASLGIAVREYQTDTVPADYILFVDKNPVCVIEAKRPGFIVAKISELISRCGELEKLRAERDRMRLAVHTAAINKMLDASVQATFDDAWQFITRHFGDLYTVLENVAELRKAILQLAVMGKLVKQDSKEGTARELLTLIENEKKKLHKVGKIKVLKELPGLDSNELPYEIPSSWEWVRLQSVIDVRDGTHDSPRDAIGRDTFPLITSKDFVNGKIDFSKARHISAKDHHEIAKRSKVEKHDILFSMIGGNIGNQAMVENETEFSIKNVALFKYYSKDLTNPFYIKRFLEHLALDLQGKAAGGAQPFVSLGYLRSIAMPIPPNKEQIRITRKVNQIMALCDELEKQIDKVEEKQGEVLGAVMGEV